jgi:hypothetical protein
MRWSTLIVLLVAFVLGCGSSPERPPASPGKSQSSARAKRSGKQSSMRKSKNRKRSASVIPVKCSKKKKRPMCLPPPSWVTRLCDNVYPDVALHMFQPGTPWVRLYMRHNAQPFNASGGMSMLGDKMQRGEEVIALRRRDSNSMQMNDISGFDVLRWNGACATIHDGEFSTSSPDEVVNARVEWRELGLPLRQKLEAQPEILETYKARRKACVGRNMGQVSADCEEFDKKLVEEVVRYVRSGADLPKPAKHPPWRGHKR